MPTQQKCTSLEGKMGKKTARNSSVQDGRPLWVKQAGLSYRENLKVPSNNMGTRVLLCFRASCSEPKMTTQGEEICVCAVHTTLCQARSQPCATPGRAVLLSPGCWTTASASLPNAQGAGEAHLHRGLVDTHTDPQTPSSRLP